MSNDHLRSVHAKNSSHTSTNEEKTLHCRATIFCSMPLHCFQGHQQAATGNIDGISVCKCNIFKGFQGKNNWQSDNSWQFWSAESLSTRMLDYALLTAWRTKCVLKAPSALDISPTSASAEQHKQKTLTERGKQTQSPQSMWPLEHLVAWAASY